MTHAQAEVIIFWIRDRDDAQISDGEEDIERERGDTEGDSNTGQNHGHLPVSFSFLFLSLGIQSKAAVLFKEFQNLEQKIFETRATVNIEIPQEDNEGKNGRIFIK